MRRFLESSLRPLLVSRHRTPPAPTASLRFARRSSVWRARFVCKMLSAPFCPLCFVRPAHPRPRRPSLLASYRSRLRVNVPTINFDRNNFLSYGTQVPSLLFFRDNWTPISLASRKIYGPLDNVAEFFLEFELAEFWPLIFKLEVRNITTPERIFFVSN